jgi:integrase
MISSMYRWAIERGLVDLNPAEGTPRYTQGAPRERVLSPEEIKILWDWLPTSGLAPAMVDILRLQLCIGARSGEIAGMRAAEVDPDNWTWTLPASRSKNGAARVTPLVGEAKKIIAARLDGSSLLFASTTGVDIDSSLLASHLRLRWDRFPVAHFTAHDLRRTLATEMAEMGVPLETIALTIGQQAGGKAVKTLVRHYLRGDMLARKKHALEAWDQRLLSILAGVSDSNVTPLHRSVDNFRRHSP